uniref:SFRICE_013757 n=1 Tax=Spodoptera frugiperda TaxID=7108 RepID=A0A2H1WA85_SPOFR
MKTYLLTKKSANSLLSQINNLCQHNMTIAEYGAKSEELFIGLTIAQADGNAKASAILSPINEKMVIKRFTDGLRNRRLSTVILARDYKELKDAVRAAEDEEDARPGTAGQDAVYAYSRGTNRNQYYNDRRVNRSRGYYNRGWSQQHVGNHDREHTVVGDGDLSRPALVQAMVRSERDWDAVSSFCEAVMLAKEEPGARRERLQASGIAGPQNNKAGRSPATVSAGLRTANKGSSPPEQNQTRACGVSRSARASKSHQTTTDGAQ